MGGVRPMRWRCKGISLGRFTLQQCRAGHQRTHGGRASKKNERACGADALRCWGVRTKERESSRAS